MFITESRIERDEIESRSRNANLYFITMLAYKLRGGIAKKPFFSLKTERLDDIVPKIKKTNCLRYIHSNLMSLLPVTRVGDFF